MVAQEQIIFTGGMGLLGGEVRKLIPAAHVTTIDDFNILDYKQMDSYVNDGDYRVIIHAAALTSPPRVDENPTEAIEVNIVGTANVVRLCEAHRLRLIYISTDYVFSGNEGNYDEQAAVHPVNKYAWSKLGGECAVRLYDESLIIRTSFGPNEFPYDKAFVDQWTSRESVSTIAHKIVKLLDYDITGVIHVGGCRRTVMDFAKELSPEREIGELFRDDVDFVVPIDTSLNCERYESLIVREIVKESEGTG